jgi:hypothetical protein
MDIPAPYATCQARQPTSCPLTTLVHRLGLVRLGCLGPAFGLNGQSSRLSPCPGHQRCTARAKLVAEVTQ